MTQGRKFAKQGFRVLLPDAMNHGERKQVVSAIPSFTFWNSIYGNLFEFETLLKHLEKRDVLHEKVAVGGVSMGGDDDLCVVNKTSAFGWWYLSDGFPCAWTVC